MVRTKDRRIKASGSTLDAIGGAMQLSRRNFFRMMGISAAAGAAQWPMRSLASGMMFEPWRATADDAIRLHCNENPYGPSAKSMEAIQNALSIVNRYPFAEYDDLSDAIAKFHGVQREQILMGCGSTEILRVIAETLGGPNVRCVQAAPTFEAISHYSRLAGSEVVSIPLTPQYAHDLDGMLMRIGNGPAIVYICNPNNPTGSVTPRKDIEAFLAKAPTNCFVIIDEAYHQFVGPEAPYISFLDQPVRDERVIVCRTFSKVFGLAGLRLGYAVTSEALASRMGPHLTEDGINGIAVRVGVVALNDKKGIDEAIHKNVSARQAFVEQAKVRKVETIPSQANFVMMETQRAVEQVISHFQRSNILVGRKFPALPTHLRVSLGKPDNMQSFWRVWDTLPSTKSS
jgi:histidinol-phosphate aminotransferase